MRICKNSISIILACILFFGSMPNQFTNGNLMTVTEAVYSDEERGLLFLEPTEDQLAVKADYDWLVGDTIIHWGEFSDDIRSNVNLPTKGDNGCDISWFSSDEAVISTDGSVIQPIFSYANGAAPVILTARISKGEASTEKIFELEVYPLPPDTIDHIAYDKDRLTEDLILNGNTNSQVKTRLYLATGLGQEYWRDINMGGCAISWSLPGY